MAVSRPDRNAYRTAHLGRRTSFHAVVFKRLRGGCIRMVLRFVGAYGGVIASSSLKIESNIPMSIKDQYSALTVLASLVLNTGGTHEPSITLDGLDMPLAESLREQLSKREAIQVTAATKEEVVA